MEKEIVQVDYDTLEELLNSKIGIPCGDIPARLDYVAVDIKAAWEILRRYERITITRAAFEKCCDMMAESYFSASVVWEKLKE